VDAKADTSWSGATATDARPTGAGSRHAGDLRIAIVGAGPAGLCMAIRLKRAGFSNFTIYERSNEVGGTWRDNTYPGAACDIPAHLYCFSFEPNDYYSRRYAAQPEILDYFRHCARKYDLYQHIRFDSEISAARFDSARGVWHVRTAAGDDLQCHILIAGTGQLSRPSIPDFPGIESFAGRQFHSARWDHGHDLAGRDVAVIGTGSSAVQFIPHIAPAVRRLTLFQRSPAMVVPRSDHLYGPAEKWLLRHVPPWSRLYRAAIFFGMEKFYLALRPGSFVASLVRGKMERALGRAVADPVLRDRLRPDYPVGCKRIQLASNYFPTLCRPNVTVVTDPIERITPDGVRAGGTLHAADTLIFATGFEATRFLAPMDIRNSAGIALTDVWRHGAEAHFGITVAGFPNFFMLYGPNTNLAHNSVIFMIECQAAYVLDCLRGLIKRGLSWLEVRPEAMERFNAALRTKLDRSVWAGGCANWYKTADGKVTNNWPDTTLSYWRQTRKPDFADFNLHALT
jgi:cation diffusion facilitator CzcD-associated flavoprotein CzcO